MTQVSCCCGCTALQQQRGVGCEKHTHAPRDLSSMAAVEVQLQSVQCCSFGAANPPATPAACTMHSSALISWLFEVAVKIAGDPHLCMLLQMPTVSHTALARASCKLLHCWALPRRLRVRALRCSQLRVEQGRRRQQPPLQQQLVPDAGVSADPAAGC